MPYYRKKRYFKIWEKNGAPEEIRTPDPQIRSLVLYPAELRVHKTLKVPEWIVKLYFNKGKHFILIFFINFFLY